MTYLEFIETLRITPRRWEIGRQGEIRNTDPVVLERFYGVACPGKVCGIFDLAEPYRWQVAASADNEKSKKDFSADIRRDLLKACGLTEDKTS